MHDNLSRFFTYSLINQFWVNGSLSYKCVTGFDKRLFGEITTKNVMIRLLQELCCYHDASLQPAQVIKFVTFVFLIWHTSKWYQLITDRKIWMKPELRSKNLGSLVNHTPSCKRKKRSYRMLLEKKNEKKKPPYGIITILTKTMQSNGL